MDEGRWMRVGEERVKDEIRKGFKKDEYEKNEE